MATGTIKKQVLSVETTAPSDYDGAIVFRKYGKLVTCDITHWNCVQGQTGQVVPTGLRPSYNTMSMGALEGTGAIAVRYYEGYLQFLLPDLSNYVTGYVFGHLEWFLP